MEFITTKEELLDTVDKLSKLDLNLKPTGMVYFQYYELIGRLMSQIEHIDFNEGNWINERI